MSFSDFICNEICSKLFTTEYKLGNEIIKEGDVADKMFIVIKGLVGIYKNHTNDCVDVVGPSNTIGETALESDCLRTATVIALENVLALQLTKEDYNSIVIKQKHKQRFAIINLLKKISVFSNFINSRLENIAGTMLILQYNTFQVVYSEGQTPHGLYFIEEGSVNLTLNIIVTNKTHIPCSKTKKETLVNKKTYEIHIKTLNSGEFFGEEELFSSNFRKTSAVCSEKSKIFFLNKESLFELFSETEKTQIFSIHEKVPSKFLLKKALKKTINTTNTQYKAFLDATSFVPCKKSASNRIFNKKSAISMKFSKKNPNFL